MLKPMIVQELGEPFYLYFLYTNMIPFKLGYAFILDCSSFALNTLALGTCNYLRKLGHLTHC